MLGFLATPFLWLCYVVIMFGTVFSITSLHWLTMWAGLEINLIGFLPIMAYDSKTSSSESIVKYFVVQALGSSLFMIGSLWLYSLSYSWEFLFYMQEDSFAFVLIVCALLIKLGAFPFHYWVPSVMAGLPWFACLLLATWQKLAPLFLLCYLMDCNFMSLVIVMVCFFAGGSSILGGVGGVNQTQLRGLIAYSSIGHMGWLVFSSMKSSWILNMYYIAYVFIVFCLFISFLKSNVNFMSRSGFVVDYNELHSISMVILLSLGGLPPFLGFVPKLFIIMSAVQGPGGYVLCFLIAGALISLYYYLHLLYIVTMSVIMKREVLLPSYSIGNFLLILFLVFNMFGGFLVLMVDAMMLAW